jgi:hypothetical protein
MRQEDSLTELAVDQWQQRLGRRCIALLDGGEKPGDVGHE